MSTELIIILAVLAPVASAAGAWGGVRFYLGKLLATDDAHDKRLDDHDERIKYVERHVLKAEQGAALSHGPKPQYFVDAGGRGSD
jgi:hypothetical protein